MCNWGESIEASNKFVCSIDVYKFVLILLYYTVNSIVLSDCMNNHYTGLVMQRLSVRVLINTSIKISMLKLHLRYVPCLSVL